MLHLMVLIQDEMLFATFFRDFGIGFKLWECRRASVFPTGKKIAGYLFDPNPRVNCLTNRKCWKKWGVFC